MIFLINPLLEIQSFTIFLNLKKMKNNIIKHIKKIRDVKNIILKSQL
jgi:hypothetical protein